MKKFVYLLSLIVLLSGCAATGFDVLEINRKNLPKGVKGYYSSSIEIELKNIEETANFNLEFIYTNDSHSWFLTLTGFEKNTGLFIKKIKFLIDDDPIETESIISTEFEVDYPVVIPMEDRNVYFLSTAFYKKIVHAKQVKLFLNSESKEFEGIFTKEDIKNFGVFYNYIKKSVIDNKTVIIK